jgi:hypothetical protein
VLRDAKGPRALTLRSCRGLGLDVRVRSGQGGANSTFITGVAAGSGELPRRQTNSTKKTA